MGRRNKNGRSRGYSYSSFQELKGSTLKFDLSQTEFTTKNRAGANKCVYEEVGISVVQGGTGQDRCVSFSLREDIADRLKKESGKYWTCGIVKAGNFERLYIIPDEKGFAIYSNHHSKRLYFKVPVGEREDEFKKYAGKHSLKYDEDNEAYYFMPVE